LSGVNKKKVYICFEDPAGQCADPVVRVSAVYLLTLGRTGENSAKTEKKKRL
jgi:hypothetical protein